jgi:dihydroorotase
VETFSDFCDPGFEHKETLETGAHAAAAGGYTRVFVVPNTSPALHSKSQIEYIVEKSGRLPVHIHPIGAVTKNVEGKELAEMYDMHAYKAIAFSDGFQPIQSAGLLIKALQYIKAVNGVIIQFPEDKTIQPGGLMNEGVISTRLGLPGKPALAEVLMIQRDLELTRYANSTLHIPGISTAKSVHLIREAKAQGINVTCSVTPQHLYFCDEDLLDYNTNLKINPPIRTVDDQKSLLEGVLDGTIDMIACHHQPHEWDSKTCEFEYARYGMIGLESCFGVLGNLSLPLEKTIQLLSTEPRKRFGLAPSTIQTGSKAELTLFAPEITYTFNRSHIKSASHNSPFLGKNLTGKVIGIVNKDSLFLNETNVLHDYKY